MRWSFVAPTRLNKCTLFVFWHIHMANDDPNSSLSSSHLTHYEDTTPLIKYTFQLLSPQPPLLSFIRPSTHPSSLPLRVVFVIVVVVLGYLWPHLVHTDLDSVMVCDEEMILLYSSLVVEDEWFGLPGCSQLSATLPQQQRRVRFLYVSLNKLPQWMQ